MVKAHIKSFSGETDLGGIMEDPEAWLEQYEDMCNVNNWDVDAVMNRNLAMYLAGEASTWYSLHKEEIREELTWDEVRVAFIERFRSTSYLEELEEQVLNP